MAYDERERDQYQDDSLDGLEDGSEVQRQHGFDLYNDDDEADMEEKLRDTGRDIKHTAQDAWDKTKQKAQDVGREARQAWEKATDDNA